MTRHTMIVMISKATTESRPETMAAYTAKCNSLLIKLGYCLQTTAHCNQIHSDYDTFKGRPATAEYFQSGGSQMHELDFLRL